MKDLKKEDMSNLSYKDIANKILEKNGKGENTLDLFKEIVSLLELPESTVDTHIADFYTSLTTDKRFLLVDGLWDLRVRHTSDKILTSVEDDEEEEEVNLDNYEEEEEDDETSFDEDNIDDDTTYDDTDDDGLSDLVVVDEDEMDLDN